MTTNQSPSKNTLIILLFLGLMLSAAMACGGFALGRATSPATELTAAPPPTEPIIVNNDDTLSSDLNEEPPLSGEDSNQPESESESESESEGTPAGDTPILPEQPLTQADLQLILEVMPYIKNEYDGDVPDNPELIYAAIEGMVGTLGDQFTRFVPPTVAERMREDLAGSFEGIGAFVRENEEGFTVIVRPIDGQPADEAGLLAGDVVIAVNGESVAGKVLEEVISLIRGPRDTQVTITIQREGVEPFDVTITRQLIVIPVVESEMLPDNIAYVRLSSFNSNATEQLLAALNELLPQNPQALILDLRDNPGGFLDQAISVSDTFMPFGTILHERAVRLNIDQTYYSADGDIAEAIPMVVLVNEGSASASEIVAGALQDTGRAVIIGAITFGKGLVQQTHTLSDGSELRVTIASWYTPNNNSINGQGVVPDIEVATPQDLGTEDDTQLQRAIEYILTGQ